MKTTILALCLLSIAMADHWAVIVAGSNGFWNYRHQADVCHAYHIMRNNGVPAENIILFSYDDVASSSQNPFKGQLFNKPDGEDVYAGCNVDYREKDVTPEKFLSVLRGEAQPNNGKTLGAKKGDKIFINFSDHGAPGLIAFPSKSLYAKDFMETLHFMHDHEMYDEMVIYIEACESGSMFEGLLPDNMNIYATTAANAHESSWGYYCSPNDMVNGKHIGSCLGDLYSIVWMEDSDAHDSCSESLSDQFQTILTKTTQSHVMEYGDLSFKAEPVGNFEGDCDNVSMFDKFFRSVHKVEDTDPEGSAVDSRDIKLHYLFNKYLTTRDPIDAMELQHEIEHRTVTKQRFEKLQMQATRHGVLFADRPVLKNHECYKDVVETYHEYCSYDEYSLAFYKHFVSLCNSDFSHEQRLRIVKDMC